MIDYIIKLKRKTRGIFRDRWVWKMAWRDARHNFSRLFLFTTSLITGIAAVVALDSMNTTLQHDIDSKAKELLGADLVVNGNKKFNPELRTLFDSIKYQQAEMADLSSMIMFYNSPQPPRLIRLMAIEGPFPFYGQLETLPSNTYELVKKGGSVMLDESLASQYEVSSGDSVKIGNTRFKVAGVVRKIPGGGELQSTFTPTVYMAMSELDSTGLVQFGSRVSYRRYFKTDTDAQADELGKWLQPLVRKSGYGFDDVQERKEDMGEAFQAIYRFFSLLAFVALILGCIGVASSVHIYAREKREEVAVLRCIGSTGWQAFNIYFIQIFILGIIGSVAGVLLGVGIQQLIPILFKKLLPVEVGFAISWMSIVQGFVLGAVVSVLFSMLPLISVRFVPPLTVLRTDFQPKTIFSKARLTAIILIGLFPIAFASIQTESLATGGLFFLGLLTALGLLALVAVSLLLLVRKFFPGNASFIWRHSLSNLFRPNNQTRVLMIAIGLGTFIIATLNIVEKSLLGQVEFTGQENQSNTILYDIQAPQKDGVVKLMENHKLPVNQVVPIVTCRLSELKGRGIDSIKKNNIDSIGNWYLTHEYRVTYRDSLHHSEELVEGTLHSKSAAGDSVLVTISEVAKEDLKLKIGDSLVFDIQGVPVKVYIGGVRKVEWAKDPPNFIFVFPPGVLENAPQIYVTATRIDDQQVANRFQQELVMQFPNVSLIDIRLILSTINELFNKLGVVVRFLAMFSIITGLVVLAGAVINSKFVRMKENVLLRTIGARTSHITKITLIEYAYLGLFSALTGMILSLGGGWLLTTLFFKITFAFDWIELLIIAGGVVILTVSIGWWNSREVIRTPPLQVLRKEG